MSSDSEKTNLQRLMELKDLYESGLITKEEMEAKKRQILEMDNPSADNPNGGIKNEPNCDIPNQANNGYRPGKFCCPSPNSGKVEQSESNNEQGNEKSNCSDTKPAIDRRKIIKLSIIAAVVVVVVVVLSIVLVPTDYNKKVAKAVEEYESQNAIILSTSGTSESTKNNHYVIFQKGDTIYYDELDKNTSVRALLPCKNGLFIKHLTMDFKNENLTISNKMMNDGRKSNLQIGEMSITNEVALDGKRAVCLKDQMSHYACRSYYYSLNNPDTIFAFDGDVTIEDGRIKVDRYFSFANVTEQYDNLYGQEYSYVDYVFFMSGYYSIKNLSHIGFSEYCSFNKDAYPMDLLKEEFNGQNFDYGFPLNWFGTSNMDRFIECLDQDIDRKTAKAEMDRILSQTVDFDDMCHEFNTNPVNAAQLYPVGERMYLAVKVDKIDYSKLDDYKYIVFSKRDDDNCYIHTNDENFASISYPAVILIEVEFDKRYRHEGQDLMQALIGELFDMFDYTIKYIFTDATLISYSD